jgi:hypothetical protein
MDENWGNPYFRKPSCGFWISRKICSYIQLSCACETPFVAPNGSPFHRENKKSITVQLLSSLTTGLSMDVHPPTQVVHPSWGVISRTSTLERASSKPASTRNGWFNTINVPNLGVRSFKTVTIHLQKSYSEPFVHTFQPSTAQPQTAAFHDAQIATELHPSLRSRTRAG